ncbi:MAG: hypothetical protein ABS70_00525 [Nitrospira sp. SCN 59-13]|nr:MAG: hypothetical protein ABS70_00525 [Nitrospira sp. SCN 59-13]
MSIIKKIDVSLGIDTKGFDGKTEKVSKAFEKFYGYAAKSSAELSKFENAMKAKGARTFEMTRTATERYNASLKDLKAQVATNAISQDTYNRAVAQLKVPPSFSSFSGIMAGVKLGAIGLAAGFAATGAAAAALGVKLLSTASEAGKLARDAGVSVEAASQLGASLRSAGLDADGSVGLLKNLNNTVNEASIAGSSAARDLGMLGLSYGQLSQMTDSQKLQAFSTALANVPGGAAKAALAVRTLGEEGVKALPLLSQGGEVIQAEMQKAADSNSTLTTSQAANAMALTTAWNKFTSTISGLGTALAANVAPYAIALLDTFNEMILSVASWATNFGKASGYIRTAINGLDQGWHYLKIGFAAFQSAATLGLAYIMSGVAKLGKALEYLLNKLPGVKVAFSGSLQAIADGFHELAAKQAENVGKMWVAPPTTPVADFVADIGKKADATSAKLAKMTEAIGGTGKAGGSTNQGVQWADKAKTLIEAALTPLDKYRRKIAEIKALAAKGLIPPDVAAKSLFDADKELVASRGALKLTSGTAEAGTQEAVDLVFKGMMQFDQSDIPKQSLRAQQDMLREQRIQTEIMRKNYMPEVNVVSIR